MEFYTLLKSCYKSGVSPFMLRSLMADLCKGNIKLSRQIECLYQLHKQSDIFAKISLCTQTDFEQLVKGYTTEQATCVYAVAKLLHSQWQIVQPSSNSTVRKIKVQKANPTTTPINIAPPQLTSPAPQAPKNKAVKQPAKKVAKCKGGGSPFAKAKNVYITSLLSNLEITTCKGGVDFEIRVLENGKCKTLKSGIIKRSDRVYINVENVVADKIEVVIPKDVYGLLEINKVSGNLFITDKNHCFEKVIANLCSGHFNASVTASSVTANVLAGRVWVEHTALSNSNIEITNQIGGVTLILLCSKNATFNLLSGNGVVTNRYRNGKNKMQIGQVNAKIKSKYGNIDVY